MKKYIKSARRKSTEILQYRGCFIVKTPSGLDVYDSDTNLQKEGLTSMKEARDMIDNMVLSSDENKASSKRRYRASQLPDDMDVFLEDIAQMFGYFTYKDIIDHSYSDSDVNALTDLREKVNDHFEDYSDADFDDDGVMDHYVRQIAAIVKGADVEASSKVTAGYYDPPEDDYWTELDPEKETIEIDIDARIILEEDGTYEYEDTTYPWAKSPLVDGDWYADFYGVYLADPIDIVENVDDLLIDKLPNEPGEYYITGHASLTFEITGVYVHRDGFWDDQGFDYDETENADDAEATYLKDESSLTDIQIEKI